MAKMTKMEQDIWVSIDKVLVKLEAIDHKLESMRWDIEQLKDTEGPCKTCSGLDDIDELCESCREQYDYEADKFPQKK